MAILIIGIALLPILVAELIRVSLRFSPVYGPAHSASGLKIGDKIIYTKTKFSMHPTTHRAQYMYPSERGDDYSYVVDKYWVVSGVLADGRVVAKTRTGKTHTLRPDDTNMHKARFVQRMMHRDEFPDLALAA
jgi:hypothetical protein